MLSPRLQMLYHCTPKGTVVADIGTDHGYLVTALVQNGKCPRAIASDIHPKPLSKAQQRIALLGLDGHVDTRLGPGLSVLSPGECQTVIVAGMGGYMIRDMLAADEKIARSVDTFILQPMNNVPKLRRYLWENNYAIQDEVLVLEEDRIYEIIVACPGQMAPLKGVDDVLGYAPARHTETLVFKRFLQEKITAVRRTLSELSGKETPGVVVRQQECEALLQALLEVENGIKGK